MTDKTAAALLVILLSAITGAIVGVILAHEVEPRQYEPLRFEELVGRQECRGMEAKVLECMRGNDQ